MTDFRSRLPRRLALRLLALSCLSLALGACGGGPQCVVDTHCRIDQRCVDRRCVPLGPLDAGLVDGSADGAPTDGSPGDTGPRDSGPIDSGPTPTGQVLALSDQVNFGAGPVARTVVTAAFQEVPADSPCTQRTIGGCILTECPDTTPPVMDGGTGDAGTDAGTPMDAGSDAGPPPPIANAGVIVVVAGGPTATLAPAADGTYPPFSAASVLWADGSASVNFRAFGTTPGVPRFMQALPAPTSVQLDTPDLSSGTATLMRLSGVDVGWTGTTNGVVAVNLNQTAPVPSTASTNLRCDFDGATAGGMLPAIALQSFEPGSATLSVFSLSQGTAGGTDPWVVTLVAMASGALPTGLAAIAPVTLE